MLIKTLIYFKTLKGFACLYYCFSMPVVKNDNRLVEQMDFLDF